MLSPPPLASIGIDVSKETLVVSGLTVERAPLKARSFANTKSGVNKIVHFMKAQGTAVTVPCVIESTGDFHLLSSLMLSSAGYTVNCINPLITKRYQRGSVRNAKDDSIDALRLAEIGLQERNLRIFSSDTNEIADKKRLSACANIEHAMQMLKSHLFRFKVTSKTIGLKIDMRHTEKALKLLEKQRKQLMAEITLRADPRAIALAEGTPGISVNQAALLSAFFKGKTFDNKNALVAFCGLDVAARRSGMWRGKEHLSKRSNPYLRKHLYLIARGLFLYHAEYRAYYYRVKSRGHHHTACYMAIARRFLRVTWWKHFHSMPLVVMPEVEAVA